MPALPKAELVADATLLGRAFCQAYTEAADAWLRELLERAAASYDGAVALAAVGGYGRGDLCPESDLDVLLLYSGKSAGRSPGVGELAERLWYPIWDEGLKLGHAVRTVKEALSLARADLDTATALLDVRHVAGDRRLTTEVAEGARRLWQKQAKGWVRELHRSVTARHDQAGEVAFLLEPDLKAARGGLRDMHTMGWLEAANDDALRPPADRALADEAYLELLDVRVALHRRTGRPGDRLSLQEQDGVAADLGCADAAELMRRVASAGRTIAFLLDDAFDRLELTGRRRPRPSQTGVGAHVVVVEGQVDLADSVVVEAEQAPMLTLDVALAAARLDARIARRCLERLAGVAWTAPDPWPAALRDRFVELLLTGRPLIAVGETLDQWGLLGRLVSEWAAVRCKPQRNPYHLYTVDRHLLEAVANAAALASSVHRPDLLVVGALLHDLGKGFPGDHTDAGVEVAAQLAPRLGFGPADSAQLVALVRHHLLLPDVATRRDLSEHATIQAVADAVGDRQTLELLDALTEADSLATGPSAWSDWKAGLMRQLVVSTAHVLDGGAPGEMIASDWPPPALLARAADEGQVLTAEGNVLTVVTADRPGVFSRVAGVLSLSGLDVLGAQAYSTDDGKALSEFVVVPALSPAAGGPAGAIRWERVVADLERALAGRLALEARLAERARAYDRRGARPPAAFEESVLIDNDASPAASVIEVRARDGVGLLYRITRALADLDLDIRSAKVQTMAHDVVDAFYVRDAAGRKITDPEHLREIERAVLHALRQARLPG
ncbi:MAG: [protein-PII] uridylyltransferase [Acidimicrobiales bacterium]